MLGINGEADTATTNTGVNAPCTGTREGGSFGICRHHTILVRRLPEQPLQACQLQRWAGRQILLTPCPQTTGIALVGVNPRGSSSKAERRCPTRNERGLFALPPRPDVPGL